jgi:sec-independent protein translocase protein TatA
MGGLSLWHWIIIIGVVSLLFGGKGKLSGLMGDLAKGIKAFKSGMKEDETTASASPSSPAPPQVAPPSTTTASSSVEQPAHDRG